MLHKLHLMEIMDTQLTMLSKINSPIPTRERTCGGRPTSKVETPGFGESEF
jgi:hypothetical protein